MKKEILLGDCLDIMPSIESKSIDLICADMPYGTTRCKWDTIIPLDKLWDEYKRIIKDNGCILLFAQTPFDKVLGSSNLGWLRYEWIWEKTQATGHLNAKKMPMKAHENILVFYKNLPTYNPQKTDGHVRKVSSAKNRSDCIKRVNQKESYLYNKENPETVPGYDSTERYPRSVLKYKTDKQTTSYHPTQKPLDLIEYLIKTYTNEGDLVLDNVAGSGTVAVACENLNRQYIVIEKEKQYYDVILKRVNYIYQKI